VFPFDYSSWVRPWEALGTKHIPKVEYGKVESSYQEDKSKLIVLDRDRFSNLN